MTTLLAPDPPLDPTPEEGRNLLRGELLDPAYHQDDLLRRLLDGLGRLFVDVLTAASSAPPLSALAAMVVGLALVVLLIWLATRVRSAPRRINGDRQVVPDRSVTAREWRERAQVALDEARCSDALVDAFRALATRQVEVGRLDETPGATAREVVEALRSTYPHSTERMSESARLFELVLYGDREATREQALLVMSLDDELAGVR
ncbi:DUF4129 domain-containing protein [Nocardioides piscis]|uniref:DUF4129 domain-containing protein n=1 Tax=Nocardioides piscis TaxID=2714938 RepID=A0A6G7YFF0_9ACTN|nr:DUF4129 domain-containing protein [Nocardioides piscis]QIK75371.1 DUF4129 domain-containing protein [Nocardioides piscis]